MKTETISEMGFIRLPQVLSLIPVKKSCWWEGVKKGRFPRGYKVGKCTFWKVKDIENLINKIEREEVI